VTHEPEKTNTSEVSVRDMKFIMRIYCIYCDTTTTIITLIRPFIMMKILF